MGPFKGLMAAGKKLFLSLCGGSTFSPHLPERVANVLLFKKGCREKPGIYRPVSLTSAVGKLSKTILRDGIYRLLETQGLIRDSQHGFVSGRSCLMNLIEFFEEVTKKVGEGSAVDVVYMDFSNVFDKIPHGRLLHKVNSHGIRVR